MKYFIAFALIAVASAAHFKPTQVTGELAEIQQIVEAINSPSTDPATAVALQELLYQMLGVSPPAPEAIAVGPALVEGNEPISVGPVIVDDSHIITAPVIVSPSPSPVPTTPESASAPLVQIILNINKATAGPAPGVVGSPVEAPSQLPETVQIVDQAPETVNVVDQAPETVNVVDQVPENVNVVDLVPEVVNVVDAPPETVNVVQPIIPSPVVNVPDSLN